MTPFLSIQATYTAIEVGLHNDHQLIASVADDKKRSSKNLIPLIDELLTTHNTTIQSCTFIALNRGPAPFTSLRVALATANGLSFASEVPLVGIDGLKAFMHEFKDPAHPITVGLLNAFNNDVYYAIDTGTTIETGYAHHLVVFDQLKKQFPDTTIRFIGAGAELFREELAQAFGTHAYLPDPLPQYVSLHQLGAQALEYWKSNTHVTHQAAPLYLKTLEYKKSITHR